MKRAFLLAAALTGLAQITAYAQMVVFPTDEGAVYGALLGAGPFFVALVSGLAMAAAFQLLLTNLSAAAGLSAIHVPEPGARSGDTGRASLRDTTDKIHGAARTIGAGFGIWAIVTASLSLFFGSWLAVRLGGAGTPGGGAMIGLTIWGVFYILATMLEASAAASAVGALAGVARKGFQSVSSLLSSVFTPSEDHKTADQAAAITAAVRDELLGSSELRRRLGGVFDRITDAFGPERHRRELEKLLEEVEVKSYLEGEGADSDAGRLILQLKTSGGLDADKAKTIATRLRDAIQRARQEPDSDKGQADRAIEAGLRASGLNGEEGEALRRRVEEYMRKTGRPELDPEGIKQDLLAFFRDPAGGFQALRSRAAHMDRATATALLSQQRGMNPEQAEMIVERVIGAIRTVTGWSRDQAEAAREKKDSLRGKALGKVEAYLASIDRPGLDPASVRQEIELLFHDPKAGAEALMQRARGLNRDDVKALLAHSGLSPEQSEKLVDQVMQARDRALETAERLRMETERRINQARDEALRQAEELRRTAASAAWWIFASALVSGLFAALGGYLAARPSL